MPDNQDFFIDDKQKSKIFALLFYSIAEVRSAADIVYATPVRDLQVFDAEFFSALVSNIARNPILSPLTAAFSIVGAIPFIAKLFVKSEINNFSKILSQLERDFGIKIDPADDDQKKSIEQKFDAMLKKRGFYHLRSELVTKKNGKMSLKFKYANCIPKFFDNHWQDVKDMNLYNLMQFILKTQDEDKDKVKQSKNPLNKLYKKDQKIQKIQKIVEIEMEEINNNSSSIDDRALKRIFELKDEELTDDKRKELYKILESINELKAAFADPTNEENITTLLNFFKTNKEKLSDVMKYIENCELFNKTQLNILFLISRIFSCFLKKIDEKNYEFDFETTFQQSRENFINGINKITPSQVANNANDVLNSFTYSFWIAFYCKDILDGRDDMGLWPYTDQVAVLAVAGGIALIEAGLKLADYYANRKDPNAVPISSDKNKYTDRSLKHQLLEEFVISTVYESKKELAIKEGNHIDYQYPLQIKRILDQTIEDQYILHPSPIAKQLDFLKKYYDLGKSKIKERCMTIVSNGVDQAISVSFVGWVIGAIVGTAGAVAASAAILSNPVTVGLVVMGLFFGATYFADSQIKKDKEQEEAKRAKIKANTDKINLLKTLEHQNNQLVGILNHRWITPLTIADPKDDRFYRRLTSKKTPIWTKVKKFGNRLFMGVNKAGGGILIARLAVLPLMAAAAATGPVGLAIALTMGTIWAIANVVKYNHDRKLAKYQRLLDDIDNRILTAQQNQDIYLKQLGYNDQENVQENKTQSSPMPISPSLLDDKETNQITVKASSLPNYYSYYNNNIVKFNKQEVEVKVTEPQKEINQDTQNQVTDLKVHG